MVRFIVTCRPALSRSVPVRHRRCGSAAASRQPCGRRRGSPAKSRWHNQPLLWTGPRRVCTIWSTTPVGASRCPPQSVHPLYAPRQSGPAGARVRRNGAPTVNATTHLVLASWWAHRVCSPSRRPRGSAWLAAGGAYNQPLLWTGPRRGCMLFILLASANARLVARHRTSSVMWREALSDHGPHHECPTGLVGTDITPADTVRVKRAAKDLVIVHRGSAERLRRLSNCGSEAAARPRGSTP